MAEPLPIRTESSALFKALFEQAGEAVLIAGWPEGQILQANPRAAEILLETPASLCGRTLPELFTAMPGDPYPGLLKQAGRRNGPVHFRGALRRRDGSRLVAELDLCRVTEALLLVSFTDISERLKANEDIELRNTAIANVTSGVTVADARQPDLPLIFVNRGFQHITGYSAREAIGRSCRFLQGDDRDQPGLDTLRQALREGEACVVQLRNYRKDGTLFHNELHISPARNEAGELTHFVGIQLDVTEQVRARESLERSEERYRRALEQEKELNEIKTRFISMVSHEFRTPMTGIQTSIALLRKYGESFPPDKRERHWANIDLSLRRMNRLLNDVLFFSRAESHRIQVERKPLDLPAHLAALLESLAQIHPGRSVRMACDLPPGASYLMDPHLLDHILHNLAGNALKYSPAESEVSLGLREEEGSLVITVEDHGIGIPAQDQHRLFEAFHRAGNVGNRQGTGLGLNIVMRAVELLEGEISFTSSEQAGSTFVVRLPIIQPS